MSETWNEEFNRLLKEHRFLYYGPTTKTHEPWHRCTCKTAKRIQQLLEEKDEKNTTTDSATPSSV
jgi:hypothetical protein